MKSVPYRTAIADFIRGEARPVDKYGHQPRLYSLTVKVGEGQVYDDEVVYAGAWLHDLGVFLGHRPEDPEEPVMPKVTLALPGRPAGRPARP